jgi:hypothetical protein
LPSFLSSNRSDSSKPYTVTPPQPAMQCREHKTRDTHTHTHTTYTHTKTMTTMATHQHKHDSPTRLPTSKPHNLQARSPADENAGAARMHDGVNTLQRQHTQAARRPHTPESDDALAMVTMWPRLFSIMSGRKAFTVQKCDSVFTWNVRAMRSGLRHHS